MLWMFWLPVVCLALWYFYPLLKARILESKIGRYGLARRVAKIWPVPIEPLQDFDWEVTAPLQLRPFKPKYHLTMALENCNPSELIVMDNTYLDRIRIRRRVMREHSRIVVDTLAPSVHVVHELYAGLVGEYLPQRFPTMFEVCSARFGRLLRNKVTKELIPLDPPADPRTCMRILGAHIDTDLLLLLPETSLPTGFTGPNDVKKPQGDDEKSDATPKYRLVAFVTCFPSGFKASEKLGLRLADIHGPVPGYKSKIERSMDRFFATLPVGKIVRRANWAVQTHGELYAGDHANHDHVEDVAPQEVSDDDQNEWTPVLQENARSDQSSPAVDINNTFLRVERQTLHRLPRTGALLFAFKTYMYPLTDIKAEGSGDAMADAIDGLLTGNVPEMNIYKKGAVWGEPVVKYLRS